MLHHIHIVTPPFPTEKLYYVSDGGKKYDNLTHGGVCATDDINILEIAGRIPDTHRDSSMRAEAFAGILIAIVARELYTFYNVPLPPMISYFLDNKGVIQRLASMPWQHKQPTKTTRPEFEALKILYDIHQQYNNISVHHVKGHQHHFDLLREEILNNRCDVLACHARQYPSPTYTHNPAQKATLFMAH